MTPLGVTLTLILVVAQFALPRRLAFIPLLIAACHTPYQAGLGGDFTTIRLVIIAGLLRAGGTGLLRWTWSQKLDRWLALWSGLALLSTIGHDVGNPFIYRCGLVLNVLGTYLYARAYIRRAEDLPTLIRALVLILIPLAGLLVFEAITGNNPYALVGARRAFALVREERNRAAGPFGTPILAGTVGAICVPLIFSLWRTHRTRAILGLATCTVIIVASASSTPLATLGIGLGALILWRWRRELRFIQYGAIGVFILLTIASNRPVIYQLTRIDLVGGSTGYHRARLIDSAFQHLGEWWLFGTDYTRHWMVYGLHNDPNNVDITSYYIHLGVIGGLPLLLCLVGIFWTGFRQLGRRVRELRRAKDRSEFAVWCVGCSLFAHAITCFTVSYFDQLLVFFYVTVGMIPALIARTAVKPVPVRVRTPELGRVPAPGR